MTPAINHVQQWFDQYGEGLNDATSFRRQIQAVEKEIAELQRLIPQLENGANDVAQEFQQAIEQGHRLISVMNTRLSDILKS